jgi:uncharacterized membrane protein YdfJ with MMPL/SSD domain
MHDVLSESGAATGTDAGFFVPRAAFSDQRLARALTNFLSSDKHSARPMVINRESAYAPDSPYRVAALTTAVRGALAGTSLRDAQVAPTGLAAGFADLQSLVLRDFAVIAVAAPSIHRRHPGRSIALTVGPAVHAAHDCPVVRRGPRTDRADLAGIVRRGHLLGGPAVGVRRAGGGRQ